MSLEVIMGPMFSGKSSELIRRIRRCQAIHKKVLVINSDKDTRSSENIIETHVKDSLPSIKVEASGLVGIDIADYDVIAIDEVQFFKNLRTFVTKALSLKKRVIISGLDGDFLQRPFGEIYTVLPLADEVMKLSALCMYCNDGTPGPFSKRTLKIMSQELIGAEDAYKAVCRNHL